MNVPDDRDRLQAYLDGELSPDEAATMEARLAAEPRLAEMLLELARDEAILREWARVAGRVPAVDRADPLDAPSLPFKPRKAATFAGWKVASIAALVLISLGVVLWKPWREQAGTTAAFARLEQFVGNVAVIGLHERATAQSGQALVAGQGLEIVGEESSAVVVFADGTRLEFDGDARVSELSGGETTGLRVVLAEGNLRADVAKQPPGRPMILATPKAEVVVLGTRFDLSGRSDATFVETEEGAVRLTRVSDGRSVEVPAGFEGIAGGDEARFAALPSPPRFHEPRFTTPGNYRTTALSPDGRTLVTTRFGRGEVVLWDAIGLRERQTIAAHPSEVVTAVLSADGRKLATAGAEQAIRIWDVETGQLLTTLDGPPQAQSLTFADDGDTLHLFAGPPQQEKTLHTWNLATREERIAPNKYLGECWAFSPSGRLLAIASSRTSSVTVWDVAGGEQRATLREFTNRVLCLAFSPDDAQLAVSDKSGRVTLWNVPTSQLVSTFRPAGQTVQGLAFSPDGTRLAMGQRRATVRFWDVATGKQLAILEGSVKPGSTATVRPMFFSSDGTTLATTESLDDGTVRLWDLPAN